MTEQLMLGVDPGPTMSGIAAVSIAPERCVLVVAGWEPNHGVERWVAQHRGNAGARLALEWVAFYGSIVGQDVFRTCFAAGSMRRAWVGPPATNRAQREEPDLITTAHVRIELLGSAKATKRALPARCREILDADSWRRRGIKEHAWSAIAVALAGAQRLGWLAPGAVAASAR